MSNLAERRKKKRDGGKETEWRKNKEEMIKKAQEIKYKQVEKKGIRGGK